ncbi:MAG: RuvX/YqgF family protein, partial [Alphaproteobacteria bacterium]|nr:RuvX/YqgF family protein [Alphaproteobacteria bacterium]
IDIPIALWDERLSTAAVERVLIDEADMTRKRRGQVIDKMAAGVILQGFLDFLGNV